MPTGDSDPDHDLPLAVRADLDALFSTRRNPRDGIRPLVRRAGTPVALTALVWAGVGLTGSEISGQPLWVTHLSAFVLGALLVWSVAAVADLTRYSAPRLACATGLALLVGMGAWSSGHPLLAAAPLAAAAALSGMLLARTVLAVAWLVPLLAVAATSDWSSVRSGPTSRLVKTTEGLGTSTGSLADRAIDVLTLELPVIGGVWTLGAVDVIAIATLCGISVHHRLPLGRTAAAMTAGIFVALLWPDPVPLLVTISLAMLLAHLGRITRSLATVRRFASPR